MTALERYAKLEAVGRYQDARSSDPREVVVSFGERSLVIMGLDDRAISHWPLASLRALGPPTGTPVELAPDGVSDERLVLEDREMSAAIAEVCPGLHRAAPVPRRRLPWHALAAGSAAAALAIAALVLWPMLPESLADLVPPEREAALGQALAARAPAMVAPADPPALCVGEEGLAALRALSDRLAPGAAPDRPLRLIVLDHPARDAFLLPGGHVVLLRGLLHAAHAPEEVAGVVAHAIGHARARDPLRATLDQAGVLALAAILLGDITAEQVIGQSAAAMGASHPPEAEARADAVAFAVLGEAGLPSLSYAALADRLAASGPARYLDHHPWTVARAKAAAAADRIGEASFTPALSDRDWIALGNICDRTRPADPAGF